MPRAASLTEQKPWQVSAKTRCPPVRRHEPTLVATDSLLHQKCRGPAGRAVHREGRRVTAPRFDRRGETRLGTSSQRTWHTLLSQKRGHKPMERSPGPPLETCSSALCSRGMWRKKRCQLLETSTKKHPVFSPICTARKWINS